MYIDSQRSGGLPEVLGHRSPARGRLMGKCQLAPLGTDLDSVFLQLRLNRRIAQLRGQRGQLLHKRRAQLEGFSVPHATPCGEQHVRERPPIFGAACQRYRLVGERAATPEVGIPAELLRLQREQARATHRIGRVVEL
jgi:hypothetical protein